VAETLRERLERNASAMRDERTIFEGDWRECALLTQPMKSRWLSTGANRWKSRYNKALYDGYGTYATSVCTNGLSSGLSSESQKWFKLRTTDDDLMERGGVKDVLGECERRMYAAFARSGFYFASKAGFGEITTFGTEAGLILEDRVRGAIAMSLTAGEYWISQDEAGEVNRLHRRFEMTIEQAKAAYPGATFRPQLEEDYTKGKYGTKLTICSTIEPNADRVPGKIDNRNMPWRSVAWDEGEDRKDVLLKQSGFQEKPFWCARWDVQGSDTYASTWPTLNALPDLRELQAVAKGSGETLDYLRTPPLMGPGNTRLNFNPRSYTAVATADAQTRPSPIWQVDARVPQLEQARIEALYQAVNRHLYVDRFLAISSMPGVQPRVVQEINLRNQEAITQLGTAVSRINREKLSPMVDRMWGIMLRTGQFPDFPPEMQGADLKIEFISPLAQMQRLQDLDAIQRTFQFVGAMAGSNPTVLDKVDMDQAVDEFADGAGVPPHIIRSDDDVEKVRESRAQQQASQQALQAAPAANQAAQAAETLSQTNFGGKSALDALVGQ
jgi:hypothetical protein